MTYDTIFGFVLALVAAQLVALAWLIWDSRAEKRAAASWRSTYERGFKSQSLQLAAVQKESPHELAVRVVELSEAVGRLSATQRRFQGRFDQYVHEDSAPDNSPPTIDRDALRREHASAILPAGIRK